MKTIRFLLSAQVFLAMALIFSCTTTIEGERSGNGNGSNSSGEPSSSSGSLYNLSSSSRNNNSNVIPKIKIVNSTGYSIYYIHIKPSISTDWGSSNYNSLADGESKDFTLSHPLSMHSEYDIRLQQSGSNGYIFTKYKYTVSNGMTITFTAGDLTYETDFPNITVQNRTGASFNGIYIKPSSAPDTAWGKNFGSLSNNYNDAISIPIPPSSYTEFDIQVRSTNPTATYTKKNVTLSNGTTLTYTRADSDVPLIGSPVIVILNNTGYSIYYTYIKASISTNWGSSNSASLSDGESRTYELSPSLAAGSVDIQLEQSGSNGKIFTKYKFTVSDGMIITFNANDLTDGSNLPNITIKNRTGVSLNGIYVKPSSAPDTAWGKNFGSLSNNYNESISIPIPPSSYTEFDVQVRSTNPTATYTKQNVTISNGMIFTYTRADSDNPLIGSPIIVIENNTGYSISYVYTKPSTLTDWGSDLASSSLPDGESRTYTPSQSSGTAIDIRLGTNSNIDSGNQFIKSNVLLSDGMIVTLTVSDAKP